MTPTFSQGCRCHGAATVVEATETQPWAADEVLLLQVEISCRRIDRIADHRSAHLFRTGTPVSVSARCAGTTGTRFCRAQATVTCCATTQILSGIAVIASRGERATVTDGHHGIPGTTELDTIL